MLFVIIMYLVNYEGFVAVLVHCYSGSYDCEYAYSYMGRNCPRIGAKKFCLRYLVNMVLVGLFHTCLFREFSFEDCGLLLY